VKAIVGHENMDFDCLGSMVAASKLHPDAEIFLQPTAEGSVLEYLNLYREHFDFRRLKNFQSDEVETLILVETGSRERLGPYAGAVDGAREIILYDHHGAPDADFSISQSHIGDSGALITLMIQKLQDRNLTPTDVEATLYLLALHQETGSLQFGSTDANDYATGQYLMENGANLDLVQEYTHRPLTAEQIDLLNDLLDHSQNFMINEIPVTFARAERDQYIPEIALLAHKLQDAENANFLAVIVGLEERVQIVLRTRYDHLDAGSIARKLGGNGHPRAASVAIKNESIDQAEDRLIQCLNEELFARLTARDLMSSPVHSVRPDLSVQDAHELMLRLGHHGLPITNEDDDLIGIITRTDVDKAINHDLTHAPVKGFMSPEVVTVEPEAGLDRLHTMLTNEQIGRLPVVEDGRLVGIVTRTDLIRTLHDREGGFQSSKNKPKTAQSVPATNVTSDLENSFDEEWMNRIREWGRVAEGLDDTLYLVGGCVRDVLLGRPLKDVDFLLEEDAIAFVQAISEQGNYDVSTHDEFRTAVLTLPNGRTIDFATARSEYYSHPSALPDVEVKYASIVQDLRRRDFTINAMAIRLTPEDFGELVDLYGGYRDLRNGVIRILYAMSFVDDPTRLFRALRFSERLGFDLEQRTYSQFEKAVEEADFDEVSGERLRAELERIFREENTCSILRALAEHQILTQIHSDIQLEDDLEEWISETGSWLDNYPVKNSDVIYYCFLFASLSKQAVEAVIDRLNFARREATILRMNSEFYRHRSTFEEAESPSDIYRACEALDSHELLIARAVMEDSTVTEAVRRYLEELVDSEPIVDGECLKNWGVEPGPRMGEVLEELFDYQLDNGISSREPLKRYFNDTLRSKYGLENNSVKG
jgi:tRNA nucleotidyltransferase (CCA-adding enzyme)